ncbi:MAG: CehA/McbA family metallohydrolase [Pseudomonadota bacterium]
MSDDVFSAPGRFWRGNLHTHSNRSDGVLEPAEVCRRYKAEGYDFIALTDHFIGLYGYPITDTRPFRDAGFTTLLGAELHAGAMENGELWHILAVGLPEDFAPPEAPHFRPVEGQESGAALAARAREAGAFVAVAHPEWSGLTTGDARTINAAHAVEVYNHGCAVGSDRPHGFYTLDQLLSEGRKRTLCATDDAHFSEPDHFGGWVMVKAEENDPAALLEALKAGRHYATTGPEFRGLHWEDDAVVVESAPVVTVIVQGRGSASVAVHGAAMTRARVPLERFEGHDWMRVTIIDAAGKRAWTNPHWRT